jgi:predicted RNase H-like HicB family nuclease
MRTITITYWRDNDFYLGYLNDYPDYRSQGMSKDELIENLRDLLRDIESDTIASIRESEHPVIAHYNESGAFKAS